MAVYHGADCHLCERALAQVRALRDELRFDLEEIAIDGDPELEAAYRELIPVGIDWQLVLMGEHGRLELVEWGEAFGGWVADVAQAPGRMAFLPHLPDWPSMPPRAWSPRCSQARPARPG